MKARILNVASVALISLLLLTTVSTSDARGPISPTAPEDVQVSSDSTPTRGFSSSVRSPSAPSSSDFGTAMRVRGPTVILIHDDRYVPHRVPAPPRPELRVQTASFTVNWNPVSCSGITSTWPQSAKDAFNFAVDVWSSLLSSSQTIVVDACWRSDLGPRVLGSAGTTTVHRNFPAAPMADTWYPAALANAFENDDLNDDGQTQYAEIAANFSSTFDWYYGTDGNTPGSKVDFASVVLHELGHGLGFFGIASVDTGDNACGTGTAGDGCMEYYGSPAIYDRFTEDGNGRPLLNYTNPSAALGSALKGEAGGVYFDGPSANAANTDNGRSVVKLYAPSTWEPGSSYSHLDEMFNGTPNALMTYSLANGESIHHPGPIMLGMFRDMGWDTGGSDDRFVVYLPSLTRNWPPREVPGVVNGGFEDGPTIGWTEYSEHGWDVIVQELDSGVTPHSGTWAAWLGWAHEDTSYVEQQVTVPPGRAYLRYWHWIRSDDVCGGDVGRIVIDGFVVDQYDLCGSRNTWGWVKRVVDLSTYTGRSVALRIEVKTDPILTSNLFVDDVSFQSGASAVQGRSIRFDRGETDTMLVSWPDAFTAPDGAFGWPTGAKKGMDPDAQPGDKLVLRLLTDGQMTLLMGDFLGDSGHSHVRVPSYIP